MIYWNCILLKKFVKNKKFIEICLSDAEFECEKCEKKIKISWNRILLKKFVKINMFIEKSCLFYLKWKFLIKQQNEHNKRKQTTNEKNVVYDDCLFQKWNYFVFNDKNIL